MTSDELDRLEALAKAATAGPWRMVEGREPYHTTLGTVMVGPEQYDDLCDDQRMMALPNAAYIAALHPGTALALIAELRRVRRMLVSWADEATDQEHDYYANAHPVHHTSATDWLLAEAHKIKAEAR